eukprot:CAMPEP_0198144928 /NCGR_PEP_ID=MMETSP1443-20131203/19633_1 /TAXON_ID=186043 /ORGANISM="Entomoneis sp., Strain CCMP2396" /LENGTH=420 /DNA_ID=CAMNT_0043808423 /DNA_START=122 /DNA_END=1384 /DNA_ORIENTATION=-
MSMSMQLSQAVPYDPPEWARKSLLAIPKDGKLVIANLPTPLYQLYPSRSTKQGHLITAAFPVLGNLDMKLFVKRDDSTGGVELGGNKIRKLEFLLAEALALDCDCVLTIGGEQSNHCRATAAASRMLGMEPHLILRTKKADSTTTTSVKNGGNDNLSDLVGNVLIDRMVGSHIYTCTPGEYGRIGSQQIVERLAKHLTSLGKKPYQIPVGGSNGLGSWGYIHGVEELVQQWKMAGDQFLDHIVFACGSGGTAAGIALGIALAFAQDPEKIPTVHAIGVCDDPDYFYSFVAQIANEMGLVVESDETAEAFVRRHLVVHQGKGLGYAVSTQEELDFVMNFAQGTGIVLDPVYSGKALYQFANVVAENPNDFRGKNVMFWHTGGALGLFEKVQSLSSTISDIAPCQRLDLYGKGIGLNLTNTE